jgi:putative pyruvate formate lyase activating enzyme
MISPLSPYRPAYLALLESGELQQRAEEGQVRLSNCNICPWSCGIDRLAGKMGVCHSGAWARVAGWDAHHGEEACLSGTGGSGAVFFSRCNLHCVFCQNAGISQADAGDEMSAEEIAQIFLALQAKGCHNINLVTPGHVTPQILCALVIAARAGLRLPLVYNTGGYDSLETLRLLDGVIDIYLPDMKFGDPANARLLSGCKNYPEINQAAVSEMYRQVGSLAVDEKGIARRGLIVRHLVLPANLAGTRAVMRFLASQISTGTAVNLMDQYRPAYNAARIAAARRPVTAEEYRKARLEAQNAGLTRWVQ